jgi:predicted NUDIX family phosphoesterase
MNPEEVLVIPASGIALSRFTKDPEAIASVLNAVAAKGYFRLRKPDAENDPSTRQIIPYIVVSEPSGRIFGTLRIAGGEPRLHGRISLGIGGHINPIDGIDAPIDALTAGMMREWNEEVSCSILPDFGAPIGVINDESDPVGRVHLGLVYVVHLDEQGMIAVRETDILEGRWFSISELQENIDSLEGWAKIIVEGLYGTT